MAAPIVYEGVNRQRVGTLFAGVKFWVARRVPTRSSIVGNIEDNGGKVVPLEKQADVLIADHARKDAPPGSVSWKYITDSVARGEALDVEEYRISPANRTPVAAPPKSSRVPFTPRDDEILVAWVRKAGEHTSGNEIYKRLAEQHPHHTWQSWRDRWVKRLALLPENRLPRPRSQSVELPEHRPPAASVPESAPRLVGPQPAPRKRVPFTEEDDRLLSEYVRRHSQLGGDKLRGNEIYKELARLHPHHPWQSWRDRWVRHLSVRRAEGSAEPAESRGPLSTPPRRDANPPASSQGSTRIQELNHMRKVAGAARTIQRVWRGCRVRRDISHLRTCIASFQAAARGYITRKLLDLDASSGRDDTASFHTTLEQPIAKAEAQPLTKEEFWVSFNEFNEHTGASPVPWVQIGERTVDLWDLWQCATEEPRHASRDWEAISERLGYNWLEEPHVPAQMKDAFEKHLLDFEHALREFEKWEQGEADKVGRGEEEEESGEEVNHEAATAAQTSPRSQACSERQDVYASSPPVYGLKRAFEPDSGSSAARCLGPVSKRRRYDPEGEIPCTPESRLKRADERRRTAPAAADETPTRRRNVRILRPEKAAVEPETQDFHFGQSPPDRHNALEPETQNFEFAPESAGQDNEDEDEELLTQQLQSEDQRSSSLPGSPSRNARTLVPSSPNRPLPTVEVDDDATSHSSLAFESPKEFFPRRTTSTRPAANPSRTPPNPRRRTLPASWSKGKQPAPSTARNSASPSLSPLPTATNARQLPPPATAPLPSIDRSRLASSSALAAGRSSSSKPDSAPRPRAATPSTSRAAARRPQPSNQPVDISAIASHYMSLGHPAKAVVRAVRATLHSPDLTPAVLRSLVAGRGIPEDLPGVWTERDDALVKEVGPWLDRMRGVVPVVKDNRLFGGDERAAAGFWRLVAKHGGEAVLGRRAFLRDWERA